MVCERVAKPVIRESVSSPNLEVLKSDDLHGVIQWHVVDQHH